MSALLHAPSWGGPRHPLLGPAPAAHSRRRAAARAAMCLVCVSAMAMALLSALELSHGGGGGGGEAVRMRSLRELPGDEAEGLLPLGGCPRCQPSKLSRAAEQMLSFDLLAAPLVREDGSQDTGAAGALRSSLCGLCDGKRVAVVGNGPLSEAQRERVAAADAILRFNRLGDGWRPGDRVDVLLARHRGGGSKGYPPDQPFHLPHVPKRANASTPAGCQAEAAAVLTAASLLLAAGNSRFDVPPDDLPKLARGAGLPAAALDGKLATLPVAQLARRFSRWAADATGGAAAPREPSSGLLGILAMLSCKPASVELYGFNFSPQNWEGHSMDLEQALLARVQRRLRRRRDEAAARGGALPPRLLYHPPACDELRRCADQGSSTAPGRACPAS